MGIGTAQNRDVEHAGHFDIPDVQRPPGYFGVGVFSIDGLTYHGKIGHKITLRKSLE
jgi:hypothetical protein